MKGSTYNQIRIFHVIAQELSISRAARALQMAAPSVSQALKNLEQEIGLPLFTRTTRKIELTEAGELLYQQTSNAMNELSLAFETVSDLGSSPLGKVRVTLPSFVFQKILKPIYTEFCERYPEIELELSVNDGTVNIVEQGFDIGIRFGDRIEEGMVAKLLIPSRKDAMFASPKYIKKFGIPTSIEDLAHHKYIYYRFVSANRLSPLTLIDKGQPVTVDAKCALVTNDTDVLKNAAISGLGIGRLLETIVEDELRTGKLVPILPEYWGDVAGLHIFFNQNAQKAKRVRVFIDFLMEKTLHYRDS